MVKLRKKKVLDKINHEFYNFGYPRCNDFKNKPETVKKRQSLIYDEKYKDLFNCIMIDTSNIYHVDIDTPDYHNCYDIMMEKYPYFKSMTKSYGCHIFIDSKYKIEGCKKYKFNDNNDIELLCNGWSYAPLSMINTDKKILELDNLKDMINYDNETDKTDDEDESIDNNENTYDKNEVVDNDEDYKKIKIKFGIDDVEDILECLDHDKSDNYDTWFKICCILKNIGCNINIFHNFSSRSNKYNKDECDKIWKSCKKQKNGVNIGTLIRYAMKDDNEKYNLLLNNKKKKIKEEYNKNKKIFCESEKEAANYIYELLKDNLLSFKGRLFYKYSNIWSDDDMFIKLYLRNYISSSKIYLKNDTFKLIPFAQNYNKCENILKLLVTKVIIENEDKSLYDKFHYTTKNKLCFNDGVLDFIEKKFIKWDDTVNIYSTIKINRDFNDYFEKPDLDLINKIRTDIFDASYGEKTDTALHFLSRALTGNIEDKRWATYLSSRNSGKGVEYALLKNSFGEYVKSFELNNLLCCRKSSGIENNDASKKLYWLLDHEFTRLAISQEVPDSKKGLKINGPLMKKNSGGGDEIIAKRNYDRKDTTINIDATFYIKGNSFLECDTDDVNETRLEFNSVNQFKTEEEIKIMKKENRSENEMKRYRVADPEIKNKCKTDLWANAIVMLIYMNYKTEAVPIINDCDCDNQNKLINDIYENFEITNNIKDMILVSDVNIILEEHDKGVVKNELNAMNCLKKRIYAAGDFNKKWVYTGIKNKIKEEVKGGVKEEGFDKEFKNFIF